MREEYTALMRGIVERGNGGGSLREGQTPPSSPFRSSACATGAGPGYRPEGAWSAEDIAETFTRVLLNGMGNAGEPLEPSAEVPEIVRATVAAESLEALTGPTA